MLIMTLSTTAHKTVGKNFKPKSLLTSMNRYLPICVFSRSSMGNCAKSDYFPKSHNPDKVVYCYNGIYYVIAVVKEFTFYLVRMEPRNVMVGLVPANIIPVLDFYSTSAMATDVPGTYSKKKSEDLISGIGWDLNGFLAWNLVVVESIC